jgi:hypothetical protein
MAKKREDRNPPAQPSCVSKTGMPLLTAGLIVDATEKRPRSIMVVNGTGTNRVTTTIGGATAQHGQQHSEYSNSKFVHDNLLG